MRSTLLCVLLTACTADVSSFEDEGATSGASIAIDDHLSGCHGNAGTSVPASNAYYLTSFGGGSDTQPMSCGGTANGTGWYAADRQRFGCGAHIQITANGKCVVVAAMDYGPDTCVENAAGRPIIDASPAVSKYLFGETSAGWSDRLPITAVEVPTSTPLGHCQTTSTPDPDPTPTPTPGASCNSATLDRDVDDGTCVQSADDGDWYKCTNGAWVAKSSSSGCATAYGYCDSASLGRSVPARTCVQSASSGTWFQCNGQGWVTPVSTAAKTGPLGDCSTWNPN